MTRPTDDRWGRRRLRGDDGVVGGAEVLPFGVLVFVLGTLLVVNAWGVVDAKFAVEAAAREAVRTAVEAPDAATAHDAGTTAGRAAFAAQGRDPDRLRLDGPFAPAGFVRCAPVVAVATVRVPALVLPVIGGYGDGFTVTARHEELIDPFRAGEVPDGTC